MNKELFKQDSIERRNRIPQRPLLEVSDFVVENLPKLVMAIESNKIEKDQLLLKIEKILSNLDMMKIQSLLDLKNETKVGIAGYYPYHQQLDQAAFDLKMLEIVLVTYDLSVPDQLLALVTIFAKATHQLPMITYEDLIYINPQSDPRTFTDEEVGNSEYDFYFGHLRIERALEKVIIYLKGAIFQLCLPVPNINQAVSNLDHAIQSFSNAQTDLAAVGMDLPKDHFAIFRKFFNTHPTRKLKGPSGAFTAAIPVLDMILGGENLDSSYFTYLRENELYFPRMGRREMADALQNISSETTLTSLCKKLNNPSDLSERAQMLSDQIRVFRGQHYKGVKHQIPEAIAGKLKGTGGEDDVGHFLRERMRIRHMEEES